MDKQLGKLVVRMCVQFPEAQSRRELALLWGALVLHQFVCFSVHASIALPRMDKSRLCSAGLCLERAMEASVVFRNESIIRLAPIWARSALKAADGMLAAMATAIIFRAGESPGPIVDISLPCPCLACPCLAVTPRRKVQASSSLARRYLSALSLSRLSSSRW